VLDQSLCLFDHHLGDLDVTHRRPSKVDDTTSPFTERCMSVTSFGALVDQQHDQIAFGVVGRDRVCDVLPSARSCRCGVGATIRARWPLPIGATMSITLQIGPSGGVFELEPEPLIGKHGVRLSKLDLCFDFSGVFEIERVTLEGKKRSPSFGCEYGLRWYRRCEARSGGSARVRVEHPVPGR